MHSLTIGLVGNPNCGKTTLFNALTGSRQRVGNWAGVTVEQKIGQYLYQGEIINVIDLPGTYSLNVISAATSLDERIACEAIISGQVDIIVNVLDAANLERNLYLTTQLLEMQVPVILAVNMMDVAKRRHLELDIIKLATLTGCPVIPLIANKNKGLKDLKETILTTYNNPRLQRRALPIPEAITKAIQQLANNIKTSETKIQQTDKSLWLALRLLESDKYAQSKVSPTLIAQADTEIKKLEDLLQEEIDIIIADARYNFIQQIIIDVLKKSTHTKRGISRTALLDSIVLNRLLGLPIFFAVMYIMFFFTINIGGAFQDFFDQSSTALFINGLSYGLTLLHTPEWLIALLANGLGKGLNTVITFIPVLGSMFLFLAFLEDSGYMARAAFVMDRFMRAVGLPGKSFVPMIVGFGCNVPAIMGTRTLENKRDRVLTAMMSPFMSCGARLAIFAIFTTAFFPTGGQNIIFLLYLIGIGVAVITGLLLHKTVLQGELTPFIMELPPYHMPKLSLLLRHTWNRLKTFLFNAAKVIIPVCMIIGTLNSIMLNGNLNREEAQQNTLLSAIGRATTPLFAPMGIQQDNWAATVGLATGILAKEVVVGTLNTLYGQLAQEKNTSAQINTPKLAATTQSTLHILTDLKAAALSIPANLAQLGIAAQNPVTAKIEPSPITKDVYGEMMQRFDGKWGAFAYLLFVLLYIPCVSTLAAISREIGRKWAIFSLLWSTAVAYGAAIICYQIAIFSRHPAFSSQWIGAVFLMWISVFIAMRWYVQRKNNTPLETITA